MARVFDVSTDVLYQELGDEAMLLDLKTENYFGLNEVGRLIWKELAACGEIEGAIAGILMEYEVSEDQLRSDVDNLLEQLADRGLVRKKS